MRTKQLFYGVFLIILLLTPNFVKAELISLTFDELPRQPVHNLNYNGVIFEFTENGLPSLDAEYNVSVGPSQPMAYISLPWLEGPAYHSILSLTFETPINYLKFGFALNTDPGVSVSDAVGVSLFDTNMTNLGVFYEDAESILWSAEGEFLYNDNIAIKKASIDFNENYTYHAWEHSFGVDNLEFNTVPIPSAIWLLGSAFIGLVGFRRKIRIA
jgi:hypothetical protein